MLLPIQGQPLQARYSVPFIVENKINDADYLVKTPGRHKEKRLCHINILKLYEKRKLDQASALAVLYVLLPQRLIIMS